MNRSLAISAISDNLSEGYWIFWGFTAEELEKSVGSNLNLPMFTKKAALPLGFPSVHHADRKFVLQKKIIEV